MQQNTSLPQLIYEMTGSTNGSDFTFLHTKQTSEDAKCLTELCGPKSAILSRSISANSSKSKIFLISYKVQVALCHVHRPSIHLYMFYV